MTAEPLPLFPLSTVLFPGATAALRIFEARYIDMVRRCMRADSGFGIVAIRHGGEVGSAEPFRVGTIARIVDWSTTIDGLLGLEVRGAQRFRFEEIERARDGLYIGHGVSPLVDPPRKLLAGQHWARELLEALLARETVRDAAGGADLDDANLVCWNLAQRLPLELRDRQMLLETDDLDARFERLRDAAALLIEESGREKTSE